MEFHVSSVNDLPAIADNVLEFAGTQRVFLFYGDMGAGKTTFIKEICTVLGIAETTSSPTFSIINEYISPKGPVYHFDFYRLKHETEALDLGYEDYFYSGNYCFIEWPEKIPNLLPDDAITLKIEVAEAGERVIYANKNI